MSAHRLLARGSNVQVQDVWFEVCEFLLHVRASFCLKAASAPGAEAKKTSVTFLKSPTNHFPIEISIEISLLNMGCHDKKLQLLASEIRFRFFCVLKLPRSTW